VGDDDDWISMFALQLDFHTPFEAAGGDGVWKSALQLNFRTHC
jgi:hypothetical protein